MNFEKNKYTDEITSINSNTTSGNTNIYNFSNNISNYSHSHGNDSGNINNHHYHSQNYLNSKQIPMKNMNFNSNYPQNHQSDGILTIKNMNFNQIHSNPQGISQFTSFSKGFMHGKNGWHCHSCRNFNFEWRSQCNKCLKYPIEVMNSLASSVEMKKMKVKKRLVERSGDWTCLKCKNVNFSFRKNCNRCSFKGNYQIEVGEVSKVNA